MSHIINPKRYRVNHERGLNEVEVDQRDVIYKLLEIKFPLLVIYNQIS